MRITFVGHASVLAETHGLRVLSDPWWRGPCFGAQWWAYPRPAADAVVDQALDYVYVSHGHHDHLHFGTLARLKSGFRCLVSSEVGIAAALRERGYDVIEVRPDEALDLGSGVHCRIWPTDGGDSLMVFSDGVEVMVNANDALHATTRRIQMTSIERLSALYPTIDYLFCGYGTASHFPNCYVIPDKDRAATAVKRQLRFNEEWVRIVAAMGPKFAFPFAADVVFLEEDLLWINEVVHNGESPSATLRRLHPESRVQAIDIAPGFVVEDGAVVRNAVRKPLSLAALREDMAAEIARANNYGNVGVGVVAELVDLLQRNIAHIRDYLMSYPHDYRCLIRLRALPQAIEVIKDARGLEVRSVNVSGIEAASHDLVFHTRAHYLRSSLTTRYGHEILFVGSGGVFEYRRRSDVARQVHRELTAIMKQQEAVIAPRPDPDTPYRRLKRGLKRIAGRTEEDLYDLEAWTVFRAT